jgi:hypothetical protein
MHDRADSFILSVLAGFAAFGLVAQTFVSKKELLAGGKDEFLSTFYTRESFIGVFNHCGSPRDLGKPKRRPFRKLWLIIFQRVAARPVLLFFYIKPNERTHSRDNAH